MEVEVELGVEKELGRWGSGCGVGEMMWRQAKSDEVEVVHAGHDRSKTGKNQHEGLTSCTIRSRLH